MIMAREENTKAAIVNSNSILIEACDREIKRLEELNWTLNREFIYHPTKEYLAPDLRKFLEEYPQVNANIEHYIRHCLEQLSAHLYDRAIIERYRKKIIEFGQ